jgi:hypothetical protein
MAQALTRLVTKLFRLARTERAKPTPHEFAKGEFAGRRRLTDR